MATLTAANPGWRAEELHVVTTGDRIQDRPLQQVGGKGLFIKEVEQALLEGTASLAVHSMKDVPAELAEGLVLGCVPQREDARDVAVTRDGRPLSALPSGARVGTSSLRRAVQLRAWRDDLEILPLRGNVDTRLRKCKEGQVDAILLAHAGLRRLGLGQVVTEVLDPELCLPAVGQGALAIELRQADLTACELVAPLHHEETAVAVAAERGVMLAVDGSCQVPVAAWARRQGERLLLDAMLAEPDGSRLRRIHEEQAWGPSEAEAAAFGVELGRRLRSS